MFNLLADYFFTKVSGETRKTAALRICQSSFSTLIGFCTLTIVFEVIIMLYITVNRELFHDFFAIICILYPMLMLASVICLLVTRYVKADLEKRYMAFFALSAVMSVFLEIWTLVGTYVAASMRGYVDPSIFMIISVVIPLCFYLDPAFFIILDVMSFSGFSWIILYSGLAPKEDMKYLNYVLFFIIQLFLGISIIITKRRETISGIRMEEQKKQMAELMESQNRFFSSMSHEIRTPVNTIIGLNEMILRENVSEEVAEDAENVQSAGRILLHLVNDILDMSKFESGEMELSPVVYRSDEMLSELAGMFLGRADQKGLIFHVNVSPDLPRELEGDDVRIKQILINVLGNAFKYTSEGSVTMSVEKGETEGDNVDIIFSVSDTGMGIKKESIPYLFNAFKRVDENSNRQIEGTGLGLSIVKQFVDLMGGKITVNSVYTLGTTFIIKIPQRIVGNGTVGEINLSSRSGIRDRQNYRKKFEAPEARVLIVDDNASNRLVAEKLLRDTKIQTDTASSGAEALRATLEKHYNVILMDDLMPEMSGVETLNKIRVQVGGFCKESKIVALTANAESGSRNYYEKAGFDGYISKPMNGYELENEVAKLLPGELIHSTGDNEEILKDTMSWMNRVKKRKHIKIATESVADLPRDLIEKYEIDILPHKLHTDSGLFRDGTEIETGGLLQYLEDPDKIVSTEAPDVSEHENFFAHALTSSNNLLYFTLSSKVRNSGFLPGSEAARSFDNVKVVDTESVSCGQGLIVLEACRLMEEGKSPEEIVEGVSLFKKQIHLSFLLDSLDYLARAGQVSAHIAGIMKAITARPVVTMSSGVIRMKRIIIGEKRRSWKKYIASCLKNKDSIEKDILFIAYVGLNRSERDFLKKEIKRKVDFDRIVFQKASPAVAANCGPGSFGLIFKES